MRRRAWPVDLAAVLLVGWAGLLAYVSFPTLFSDDPVWDGGVSLLGAGLAVAHAAAAIGLVARAGWGRRLGLVIGGIGLFGTGAVLVTHALSLASAPGDAFIGSAPAIMAIPAGMLATYVIVFVILWRARDAFNPPPGTLG